MSNACWLANQRMRLRSPGKFLFFDLGAFFTGQREEDQSDGLSPEFRRWAGHAGDADSQGRAAAFANSLGQRGRNFAADGAVLIDQFGGNIGERSFHLVRINHCAATGNSANCR